MRVVRQVDSRPGDQSITVRTTVPRDHVVADDRRRVVHVDSRARQRVAAGDRESLDRTRSKAVQNEDTAGTAAVDRSQTGARAPQGQT